MLYTHAQQYCPQFCFGFELVFPACVPATVTAVPVQGGHAHTVICTEFQDFPPRNIGFGAQPSDALPNPTAHAI